ncbi:MAG: hypothetical protein ACM3SQ_06055, partial [Betaproteobacteria bacterium]
PLVKRLVSSDASHVTYELIVTNARSETLVNLSLRDDLFLAQSACTPNTLLSSQTLTIARLDAHSTTRLQVTFPVPPSGSGFLLNTPVFTSATNGTTGSSVTSLTETTVSSQGIPLCTPLRQPMINELVVQPQRDWDDSGGAGDGIPFDDVPGASVAPSAAVTPADQWIEIRTNTGTAAELAGWTLSFIDAGGTAVTLPLTASVLHVTPGSTDVVVGAPAGSIGVGLNSVVTLTNSQGTVVDVVNLAAVNAALGPATGVNDEAVARIPDGTDTGATGDFQRRPATIGKPNQ